MKKRSQIVSILLSSAVVVTLSGCEDDKTNAQVFENTKSCEDAAQAEDAFFSASECTTAFETAQVEHERSAPRYDSLALCEEQHGAEACGQDTAQEATGRSTSFMPFIAGYFIGQSLAGNRGIGGSQPVYKTSTGTYSNATGAAKFNTLNSKSSLSSSAVATKAATTAGKAPMTAANVKSSGGFGASRTASKGFSSGG
jgi:uncharacterized protein YgiB involved in biofilm formation